MISLEIPRREQQARGLLHPEALDTERTLQSTTYQILGVMRCSGYVRDTCSCCAQHEHVSRTYPEQRASQLLAGQEVTVSVHLTRVEPTQLLFFAILPHKRDNRLVAMREELREFNRAQLQINARLGTLMTKVFQERDNGAA